MSEDRFRRIKYMGFCLSQMPPDDVETSFEDFVNYAKFNLSVDKGVLFLDPIWNDYTDEAILVEYFANLFTKSKEERQRFESALVGNDGDFADWADKMIADNQKELGKKAETLEDRVTFAPDSLGEH